ncbi:MAG TPA: hypothetical protein VLA17_02605 [Candidatus Limnocylindria bacterium]|nr:hypothetical protein [Candidatus Limnocylindria bacterium]
MNPSVILKVIAVLAVVQGVGGALRALQWFDMGSDLLGQGLVLLPVVGVLAFARGAIVTLLAAGFLVFALGAFLQRSWALGLGIVLSVINLLLVVSLAIQGESLAAAVPWGVIPAVMLIYLLSVGGRTSLGGS